MLLGVDQLQIRFQESGVSRIAEHVDANGVYSASEQLGALKMASTPAAAPRVDMGDVAR